MSKPTKAPTIDLGARQSNYAVYLPAISSFFTRQLRSTVLDPDARVPAGFENGYQGMDFLRNDSYYHYPWGLYSAGHATLDLSKTDDDEPMVQQRDKNGTMILGDSGGFQIASGVLKLDWSNAMDINDPARTQMCEKILRWLEHTADWSMTLDVPPFSALPPFSKKTGLTSFDETLDLSLMNLDYFVRNRVPGATKFLNVISGTNRETGKIWYDAVKVFSDEQFVTERYGEGRRLEGFAFAGIQARDMHASLSRLLDMIDDGLIQKTDWIHVLGTGKLPWACYLTTLQRKIRDQYNPNFTFSFDAASPFVNTAYGQCYTYNFFQPGKFSYYMDKAFDSQKLKGSTLPVPFGNSPIMSRLTMGDLCPMSAGDLDKNGKPKVVQGAPILNKEGEPKLYTEDVLDSDTKKVLHKKGDIMYAERDSTSWDSISYLLYMSHSVYNHIDAVQEANRLADVEAFRDETASYKGWKKPEKRGSKTGEVSPYVPVTILLFKGFVDDLFDPNNPDPRKMLDDYSDFLEEVSIAGDYANGSSSESVRNAFFTGV